jgi:hypothetical protein
MKETKPKKPKLTDAERYKRFLDVAKKVAASDSGADLEKAITRIARNSPPSKANSTSKPSAKE